MYETPTKGDLDRNLSTILHEAHRKAREGRDRLSTEHAARGLAMSGNLIGEGAKLVDRLHAEAVIQATHVLREFIERMNMPPKQITTWARPHLENLTNTLLGQIPPAGLPELHQRVWAQYALVLHQRVDSALRDIDIGFINGSSVRPAVPSATPAAHQAKEVVSFRPSFGGLSIDFNELLRRLRRYWKAE